MYPLVSIGGIIDIYTFGLCMIIAWCVFFWLLHKYAAEAGMTKHIFSDIVGITLSIFFFSRIIYIFTEWRNEKYLFVDFTEWMGVFHFLKQFFITEDYHLSLAGWIIGWLIIILWKAKKEGKNLEQLIDSIVMAFLISAPIAYFGALLGGQIYGIPFDSFFSISYTDKNSIVPWDIPRFPLPVFYILACVGIVLFLRKLQSRVAHPIGFIGYVGLGIYSSILFLGEFLGASEDMFSSFRPYITLNQIVAVVGIIFSCIWILNRIRK